MDPKVRAAERCLKRLGVAVKTFALYPLPHPVSAQAADGLLAELRQYTEAYGSFGIRITKHAFTMDSTSIESGAHSNLAFYFFTRRLSHLTVKPAVTGQEVSAFLSTVCQDRLTLEEAGGVAYLLWQADVRNILATELTLEQEVEQEILGINAFHALLGHGRLSPQERETIVDILRAGAQQVAMLLRNIYDIAGKVFKDITPEEQMQHVHQAIRSLDRVVLDEPLEEQPALYKSLAAAQFLLGELGPQIHRTMLAQVENDSTAKVLLDHLSTEQLAQAILGSLAPGNVADQVATLLRSLSVDQERARAIVTVIGERLQAQGGQGWLAGVVMAQFQGFAPGREPEVAVLLEFDPSQVAIGDEEYEQRLKEARAIDEAAAIREVIGTLVDVLRHEEDEENQTVVAEALESHLSWMIEQQEFVLLARVLEGLKAIAATSGGRRAELATGILRKFTDGRLLEGLLAGLWNGRGTQVEKDVQACLQVLSDRLVSRLMRILGDEPRAAMRAALCDLLVVIGRDHVDEIGVFTSDSRWYLVRNVADILGRLRSPQALGYLKRLGHHVEYRVRRETVDALANIGTEEAETLLAAFIDDPDQRIQLRALQSLDTRGAHQAMPRLIALLQKLDLLNREFELKCAAIEALGRINATEALPVLKRLARRRLVLGQRGREIRRLAGVAVTILEGQPRQHEERLLTAS